MWWETFASEEACIEQLLERAPLDERSLGEWATDLMREKGLMRSNVIRASKLNPTFGYQILAGQRRPSRDKLIQLAFGLGLDAAGASSLLERGEAARLRPHVARDIVIAHCLERGLSLPACDDLLWSLGEPTILPYGTEAGKAG